MTIQKNLIIIIIIVLVAILIYEQGKYLGLQEGFDQGFISGQQYQTGLYILYNNININSINQTWYVIAGQFNYTSNLNPYKIKYPRTLVVGKLSWINNNITNITEYQNPWIKT